MGKPAKIIKRKPVKEMNQAERMSLLKEILFFKESVEVVCNIWNNIVSNLQNPNNRDYIEGKFIDNDIDLLLRIGDFLNAEVDKWKIRLIDIRDYEIK